MATTWSDIQRLAADLQRAQLADGLKRLSEYNCVEVVSNLIFSGAVDLVVSTDGKEYITRSHLNTEIKNECAANNNRISLTELAAHLRVEFSHVENAIASILREPGGSHYIHCAGELVNKSYIDDLCCKMNLKLREVGQIALLQLTRNWDVPAELLNNYILPELGRKLHAIKFDDHLFTTAFISSLKRKIIAILCALTKPTLLSNIFSHLHVSQQLFFTMWNELIENGKVFCFGHLLGTKNSLKSIYVPKMHVNLAMRFVKHSVLENGFIDCGVLKKLNIPDQGAFLKELFPESNNSTNDLIYLPSAIITPDLWNETIAAINESMKTSHYCVVEECLPSSLNFFNFSDIQKIVEFLLKQESVNTISRSTKNSNSQLWWSLEDCSIVYDESFLLVYLIEAVEGFIKEKAKHNAPLLLKALKTANVTNSGKERGKKQKDDDNWNVGSSKGAKKKGGKKSGGGKSSKPDVQHCEENSSLTSISTEELLHELGKNNKAQLPDTLIDELLEEFSTRANTLFREAVENCLNMAEASRADEKRRTHDEKLNRARALYTSICVFEIGANSFEGSLKEELIAHLLKTRCLDFSNLVLSLFVDDIDPLQVKTVKIRNEYLAAIPDNNYRITIQELFEGLTSLEKFHEAVAALHNCSLVLRQPDKSARQSFLLNYCDKLREQLLAQKISDNSKAVDAPIFLLSFVIFACGYFHKIAVHASGRFVAQLSTFLVNNNTKVKDQNVLIPEEILNVVLDTQKSVVSFLKQKPCGEEETNNEFVGVQTNVEKLKCFLNKIIAENM